MKLSEMRELLTRDGIQLTKSLGQNFLHDANQLRRIIDLAELTPNDRVLEIGPGLGPLTQLLLARAGEVLAIEKDARLVAVLKQRLASSVSAADPAAPREPRPVFRLLHDDALRFLQREPRDWSEWKLVANLPYSVASPLLVELAQGTRSPERLVVTLQLEVASRLMAAAGDEDYGLLTLLVQIDFEPRQWFKIPRGCFFPEPDVDSACVCLVRRTDLALTPEERCVFIKLVKRAFSQRRKMMFKLLKQDWPETTLRHAFIAVQLDEKVRAEVLSPAQFVSLARELCPGDSP